MYQLLFLKILHRFAFKFYNMSEHKARLRMYLHLIFNHIFRYKKNKIEKHNYFPKTFNVF